MLKILGAVIVISMTTLYGFYRSSLYSKRLEQIRQLIYIVSRIKSEIQYSYTSLPDAFNIIVPHLENPFSSFFLSISEQLNDTKGDESFQAIWNSALDELMYASELNGEQEQIVKRLGEVLGTTDLDDQVLLLQQTIERLQLEEALAREEQTKYATLWRNLGALAGCALVILLI